MLFLHENLKRYRILKNLTQEDVADYLSVTPQSVSKWERGETLPDTALLIDLANILETTVDNILNGGERILNFGRKITVKEMREGIECVQNMGRLLGKDNYIYQSAIYGINTKMNVNIEEALENSYTKEAFIAEAIIQNMKNGSYIDLTDVKNNFEHEHWIKILSEYAAKYGIK
jgi:transcriptional regulator with XRE-family HTH domain